MSEVVKILRAFQPGDIVILECPGVVSDELLQRLKQYAEQETGLKVLVLGDGIRVVAREEAPHSIDTHHLGDG